MYAIDLMNANVVSVHPEMELKELVKILLDKSIGGAPVIDKQRRIVGIITDVDLISVEMNSHGPSLKSIFQDLISSSKAKKELPKEPRNKIYKVKDIMATNVITVEESATLHEIIEIIVEKEINRIPVINKEGKLIGIISRSDILRYIQATMV